MKIAITGGTGFIGNNLVSALTRDNHSLRVLVRNHSPSLEGLPFERIKGHLLDPDALDQLVDSCDVMIHLASKISIDPRDEKALFKTNVEGSKNVIRACLDKGVKKLIYFSSIHAHKHGGPDHPMDENSPYVSDDAGPYDRTKVITEKLMMEAREKGLDVTILNPSGVMGPFDYAPSLIGTMIWRLYTNRLPVIVQGGYNWVDVRDVIFAVKQILDKDVKNEKFMLAGHYRSLPDLAAEVCKNRGAKYNGIALPIEVARLSLPFSSVYSRLFNKSVLYTKESLQTLKNGSKYVSYAHANEILGFEPRPFEESIRDTVKWMKKNLPAN